MRKKKTINIRISLKFNFFLLLNILMLFNLIQTAVRPSTNAIRTQYSTNIKNYNYSTPKKNTPAQTAISKQNFSAPTNPFQNKFNEVVINSIVSFVKNITMKYSQYLQVIKPDTKLTVENPLYAYRQLIYNQNIKRINDHNSDIKKQYIGGLNQFTDFSESQFLVMYAKLSIPPEIISKIKRPNPNLGSKVHLSSSNHNSKKVGAPINDNNSNKNNGFTGIIYTTPPKIQIDWSCKASPVINQGTCGACYIIAPVQSVYITLRIYNQPVLPFSIQQILSCISTSSTANGCSGGYFSSAYDYLQNQGIGGALMYPYDLNAANQGSVKPCNSAVINNQIYKKSKTFIKSSQFIPSGDCAALVNQLKISTISVSIAAQGLQFYQSGTYNSDSKVINHGVVLVGYDPVNQYRIKNSWGRAWGNSGYAFVSQSVGVCDFAMYPYTGLQDRQKQPTC